MKVPLRENARRQSRRALESVGDGGCPCPEYLRSAGRLQGLGGGEELVEVRERRRPVAPCAADRAAAVDQERRPIGDVAEAAWLDGYVQPVRRLAVPVREQGEVEVGRRHQAHLR